MSEARVFNCNFFVGAGRLVEDAMFFTSRTGRPKVTFRMMLPRDSSLPRKMPDGCDFYSVIALGKDFVPLLDHLTKDAWVVVVGYIQSRDIVTSKGRPSVAHEVGARAIYLVKMINAPDVPEGMTAVAATSEEKDASGD